MKLTRKRMILALGIVALAVLFLFPWKRVVVAPPMRVRILDEFGNPAPRATVKQKWEYRVIGSKAHQEIAKADENGYVSFPERTERISLMRLVPSVAREIVHLPHGYGFGSSVVVWAYGNDPALWYYHPFSWYQKFPQELQLKRHDEGKYPHETTWP